MPSPNPSYPQEIYNAGTALPVEYQQVEYIESTETQYIDTGVYPLNANHLLLKGIIETNHTDCCYYGSGNPGNFVLNTMPDRIQFGVGGYIDKITDVGRWTLNEVEIFVSDSKQKLIINNEILVDNNNSVTINNSKTIYLFGRHNNDDTLGLPMKGKIYYFKIYNGSTLVRDFIPCYRKADNEIGMYDTVTNTFYTNQGTDTFLKGNDMNVIHTKVRNKNLFDKDTALIDRELNGSYGTIVSSSGWYVSDFIRVKPNTKYRLTKGVNGSSNCFYDINKKFIKTVIGARDVASPNDDRVAYVRFNGVLTDLDISSIQFEEGSAITDYVAHQEQKFIFPLGNEKLMLGDYLADDGIHRVRGQVILDGSESFIKSNNYRGNYWIELRFLPVKFKRLASFTCTHAISVSSLDDFKVGTCLNDGTLNLWLGNETQFPTVESFKAYLAEQCTNNKPVTVECELEQETVTPYTSAQQKVYNEMKRAISYEEQTNVSSLDTVSPIFTVIAFKDADLVITSLDNQLTLKE